MRTLMFAVGFCMAQVFVPAQAASFATISPAATGRASTMLNAGRQLGGAIGVAIFTTVIVGVGAFHDVAGHARPDLASYHAAFLTAVVLALVGAAAALTIHDADAAATMTARRSRPARQTLRPSPPPATVMDSPATASPLERPSAPGRS